MRQKGDVVLELRLDSRCAKNEELRSESFSPDRSLRKSGRFEAKADSPQPALNRIGLHFEEAGAY